LHEAEWFARTSPLTPPEKQKQNAKPTPPFRQTPELGKDSIANKAG
jgi:hypothetical protein